MKEEKYMIVFHMMKQNGLALFSNKPQVLKNKDDKPYILDSYEHATDTAMRAVEEFKKYEESIMTPAEKITMKKFNEEAEKNARSGKPSVRIPMVEKTRDQIELYYQNTGRHYFIGINVIMMDSEVHLEDDDEDQPVDIDKEKK